MANQEVTDIEIDFRIGDHPYLGYRREDCRVYEFGILQDFFMGNTVFRLPGLDLSSSDGWRGLGEWCLKLDDAVEILEAGSLSHVMMEPDSDDEVLFRVQGPDVVVTSTRVDGVGVVELGAFLRVARDFLRRSVTWIHEGHPGVTRDPDDALIWERLDRYA